MKQIIIISFYLCSIYFVKADCISSGMHFFPETREISLNSKFIIQGYAYSQKTINSFVNRKLYLESECGDKVELCLHEILTGQMYLTQAIFYPMTELKPATTYYLKYTNQTSIETNEMVNYNRDSNLNEEIFWTTVTKEEVIDLYSDINFKFEKTEVFHYGCGPSANAVFSVKNKPDFEVWYKAEVVELDTNQSISFYLKEWKGKLNVGHDMCSGAFTFKKEGKYKVRFTPINTEGQPLKVSVWKFFNSPFMNDKYSLGKG